MSHDINRRNALKLLGATAGGLSLSGVAASNTPTAGTRALGAADTLAEVEGETVEWRYLYDLNIGDFAFDVDSTDDGYALAGSSYKQETEREFALLVTDETGEEMWRTTFGGDGDQVAYGLLAVSDGYVLCGHEREGTGTVVKLDNEGTEQWRTNVGVDVNDVSTTTDGGYVVAGKKDSSEGGATPLLGKLTADGSVEWTTTYEEGSPSYFNSVIQTPDGGYALAGYANLNANWTVKTDSEGTIEWSTTSREGEAMDVTVTADGDILSTGNVVGSGSFSPYLTRFAPDGTIRFRTQYDAIDASSANTVSELSNGDIVLSTDEFGLLLTDSEGTKQWFEDYDGNATSHLVTDDDSVVVSGHAPPEDTDFVLAKTRPLTAGDRDAADDSRENATEIESGEQVSGTLSGKYDQDWYTFAVEQEETVSIDWSLSSPEDATLTYDYELRTPSGESIEHAETYQGEPGQYYLYIRPDDADTAPDAETHRYTFTVTAAWEDDQNDESGDGDQTGDSDGDDGNQSGSDDDDGVDVDEDEC